MYLASETMILIDSLAADEDNCDVAENWNMINIVVLIMMIPSISLL